MAQKKESPKERPLQSFNLKDFLAVNTTNSRTAIVPQAFYNLENIQPLGAANLHTINDISAVLATYASVPYTDLNVNLNNIEHLIQLAPNGSVYDTNLQTNVVTTPGAPGTLSGGNGGVAQWQNTNALIIDPSGYYSYNGTTLTSLGGTTGAPSSGTCIAVYQNRVWIGQGRLLYYSAPNSFSDFSTASGGGFKVLNDPALHSTIQQLFAANGYLYYWGVSSVNAISDLYIPSGASPPTPNFTDLNISANVGTDQIYSIQAYGRLIVFANRAGVWTVYGTTVTPISSVDPNNAYNSSIDGTWQYVDFSQTVSAAQVISNSLLTAAFLIKRANDPVFGSNIVIAMYTGNAAGGRWWFANYGSVSRITTAIKNGQSVIYCYIGSQLFQLFADTTSSPAFNLMTALWDFQDPITAKQVIKGGMGISIFKAGAGQISMYLDTENASYPLSNLVAGSIQWINNFGATVTWQNNFLQTVTWLSGNFNTLWAASPQGFAKYVGFTVKSTRGIQCELQSLLMDYKWAARWVGN